MRTLFFLTSIIIGFAAYADTDTICWTPPTERTDTTPLLPTEIGGYNIYGSTGILIQGGITGTCVTIQASSVDQQFYGTTYDTDGR